MLDSNDIDDSANIYVAITPFSPDEDVAIVGEDEDEPPDKHMLVYMIMLLLGAGILLPYNVLITAVDYFNEHYPGSSLEFLIPMFMNYPSPFLQVFMVKYGNGFSFTNRVVFWFTLESLLLIWIPFIPDVFTTVHNATIVIITCIFVFGIATAVLQSTLFGFGGLLPNVYTQALMSGNGIAGVVVCACRILTKLAYSKDSHDEGLRKSTLVYFILASCITALCSIGYLLMIRQRFTSHHLSKSPQTLMRSNRDLLAHVSPTKLTRSRSAETPDAMLRPPQYEYGENGKAIAVDNNNNNTKKRVTAAQNGLLMASPQMYSFRNVLQREMVDELQGPLYGKKKKKKKKKNSDVDEQLPLLLPPSYDSPIEDEDNVDYVAVLKKIALPAFSVTMVFIATFVVFPGLVSELRSHDGVSSGWFSIILITQFNVFDLMGRTLPKWVVVFNARNVWIPTMLRLGLYPLFLMCHGGEIRSDAWVYVFMGVFAFSNGYLASVSMMCGPSLVNADEKEGSGYIMALFLNFGILIGSHLALLLKKLNADKT